jgi:hypothetical protein
MFIPFRKQRVIMRGKEAETLASFHEMFHGSAGQCRSVKGRGSVKIIVVVSMLACDALKRTKPIGISKGHNLPTTKLVHDH